MSFIFPPSPAFDDIAINGSVAFRWDGVKWVNARITGPIGVGEAPPTGELYVRDGLAQDWEPSTLVTDGGVF